jgi:cation diffusion facilitator family transporter
MTAASALSRLAWLSIAAALGTIALKTLAWALTGSVGFLSDAAESLVNLAAAILALVILQWVARPPDAEHMYGHEKAEYFSAGVEGTLICVAAAAIGWLAVGRLFDPVPLHDVGVGIAVSIGAGALNFAVARTLIHAGRQHRSLTLEADGQHLMTDVWTSAGVVVGVAAVAVTGWGCSTR